MDKLKQYLDKVYKEEEEDDDDEDEFLDGVHLNLSEINGNDDEDLYYKIAEAVEHYNNMMETINSISKNFEARQVNRAKQKLALFLAFPNDKEHKKLKDLYSYLDLEDIKSFERYFARIITGHM